MKVPEFYQYLARLSHLSRPDDADDFRRIYSLGRYVISEEAHDEQRVRCFPNELEASAEHERLITEARAEGYSDRHPTPDALQTLPVPQADLSGLTFVLAGVFDQIGPLSLGERVKRLGGKVKSSPSAAAVTATVDYLVVGRWIRPVLRQVERAEALVREGARVRVIDAGALEVLLETAGRPDPAATPSNVDSKLLMRAVFTNNEDVAGTRLSLAEAKLLLCDGDNTDEWQYRRVAGQVMPSFAGERFQTQCEGVDLSALNFEGADLSDSYMSGSVLTAATLADAILDDAKLNGCNGHRVSFRFAKAKGASFSRGAYEDADFSSSSLSDCDFVRAKFARCNFSNAKISRAELNRAVFEECNFRGALVDRPSETTFIKCDLRGADLRDAQVLNMKLRGCSWDETTRWPEGLNPDE